MGFGAPKYMRGMFVSSPSEIIEAARRGTWIYDDKAPRHPSIFMNMSLATIAGKIARKHLRLAIRNPINPYVFKVERMDPAPGVPVQTEYWATCSELPSVRIITNSYPALQPLCEGAALRESGSSIATVRLTGDTERLALTQ